MCPQRVQESEQGKGSHLKGPVSLRRVPATGRLTIEKHLFQSKNCSWMHLEHVCPFPSWFRTYRVQGRDWLLQSPPPMATISAS